MEEEKLMKEVYGDTWGLTKKMLNDELTWEQYVEAAEKISKKYKTKSTKQWKLCRGIITGTTCYMEELMREKSQRI